MNVESAIKEEQKKSFADLDKREMISSYGAKMHLNWLLKNEQNFYILMFFPREKNFKSMNT